MASGGDGTKAEIEALRRELARRRASERLIFGRSAAFARADVATLDARVAETLEQLGEVLGLDGVALVRLNREEMAVVQEWSTEGRNSMTDSRSLTRMELASTFEALGDESVVVSGPVPQLADRWSALRGWWSDRNVGAVVAVSLAVGDHLSGALIGEVDGSCVFDDDDGHLVRAIGEMIIGAIERLEAEGHLRRLAMSDRLTGVMNRAGVMSVLANLLERPGDKSVCVVFVDLNGFKAVNDDYGHKMGDEVLTAVAGRITSALRPGDVVGRIGGDEFLVVCDDVSTEEVARTICRRIHHVFAEPIARVGDKRLDVGASVGAVLAAHGANIDIAIDRADQAMYEAKRRGSNEVQIVDMREDN